MPSGGQRPAFGRIDPVVWIPVAAILIVAMLFLFGGFPPVGIGMVVLAVLLVLIDARIHRPRGGADRQPVRSRPQRRPSPQGRQRRDIR
ncbi:MAG TPA: hypothetical protein VG317_00540 [Pseudonocardiaceae bacterium]|nr:hypothetical protein [Pseudonocardiaceae bacterium]